MKIEKIEIKGLFGKKDISWELNPQVNVLVGVNGSGKSTILGILHDMLNNSSNNINTQLFNQAGITFFNNLNKILYTPAKIIMFKNKEDVISVNDLLTVLYNVKHIQDYEDFFEITFQEYEIKFKENNEELLNNLYFDLIEANLTNSNANQTFTRSNRKEENVLDLEIRETIDELNKIKTDELITRLTGSLNVFFNQIDKHVSYENNELVYTDTQLQKKLNYSHLSSGERQLIYILLRVALSNGDKSKTAIILMDEPEISLHLDWQEHFIKQLTILNPDAQFIIVTHSPALIMNGWNDIYVDMEEITTWQ